MLKKILFCILIFVCAATVGFAAKSGDSNTVKIYVADAEMMRLIPISISTNADTPSRQAKFIISRLIEGFDDNPKIRRTIPHINGCMSIKVTNATATVNINRAMTDNHTDGRDLEKLTVYSIINSLLSVDGIDCVKFTFDGKAAKDFMGYMDMRVSFTAIETI